MYPGRKNPLFTEDGICTAILGNLEEIEAGRQVLLQHRAEGGLPPGLAQPFDVADGLGGVGR